MTSTHDIRGIANHILDLAQKMGFGVTNMAINKIAYFVYADYLVRFGKPPSSAKIEAWEHGPVFREIYSSFKGEGDQPIRSRASRLDAFSGNYVVCRVLFSSEELELVNSVAQQLIPLSAAKLRRISHEPGGPWDRVWNHEEAANVGMQITDELILTCTNAMRLQ